VFSLYLVFQTGKTPVKVARQLEYRNLKWLMVKEEREKEERAFDAPTVNGGILVI
jgi:hypothetical protein